MKRFIVVALSIFLCCWSLAAEINSNIAFTAKELDAAFTLIRPEYNFLEFDGRSGTFTPAPGLKYVGVQPFTLDVNLSFIADIVDLQMNHIRNKPIGVQFQSGGVQITVPLEDRARAIHSTLGSINFSNVSIDILIGPESQCNREQLFVLKNITVNGDLSGTGLLKSQFVLRNAKKLLRDSLAKHIRKILDDQNIQDSIAKGLLSWSRLYSGQDYQSLVPGSIVVDRLGIHYTAQF